MLLSPYFARLGSIRAQARPISPVWAQYGLKRAYVLTALRACGASYAIAPCGGNTLRGYGYVLGLLPCAHTP